MNEQLFRIICALCANPNIVIHDAADYARRICATAETVFKHAIEADRRMYEKQIASDMQKTREELAKAVAREVALREDLADEDVEAVKEKWGRRPVGEKSNDPDSAWAIIWHVAGMSCQCQTNATEVDANYHRESCIVGKAQAILKNVAGK